MALSQTADELGDVVTSSTARVGGVMKDYENILPISIRLRRKPVPA